MHSREGRYIKREGKEKTGRCGEGKGKEQRDRRKETAIAVVQEEEEKKRIESDRIGPGVNKMRKDQDLGRRMRRYDEQAQPGTGR